MHISLSLLLVTSILSVARAASVSNQTLAALNYEKSTWATGSVLTDPFYQVPSDSGSATPGTLLKVENNLNTSLFTLPPSTALSRIVYQSQNFNGTNTPASAFVLWPYSPRSSADGYQLVSWVHGTSGFYPNCAPSHLRNLWQHFLAPFQLAHRGYVVVGPDYAGMGVGKDAAGKPIVHQYLAQPAGANDVFYSVQAAQQAFPSLSKNFVVAGHSQGAGITWNAAQRQALQLVKGYLGAVALAPVTEFLLEPESFAQALGALSTLSMASIYPGFNASQILSAAGQQLFTTIAQLGGCLATLETLYTPEPFLQPNWRSNPYVQAFAKTTGNGNRPISGPLLIMQGTADEALDFNTTVTVVNQTAALFPDSQIEFVQMPGVSHNGAMTSLQHVWLDWIADRFAGVELPKGLQTRTAQPAQLTGAYQFELDLYIGLANESYEAP